MTYKINCIVHLVHLVGYLCACVFLCMCINVCMRLYIMCMYMWYTKDFQNGVSPTVTHICIAKTLVEEFATRKLKLIALGTSEKDASHPKCSFQSFALIFSVTRAYSFGHSCYFFGHWPLFLQSLILIFSVTHPYFFGHSSLVFRSLILFFRSLILFFRSLILIFSVTHA